MTQWRSEFRTMPIAPQPVLHGPLADLLEWQAMAQGAYSVNTLRAQKADGAIFQAYCESVGEAFLPTNPHTVRAFIGAQVKAGKKRIVVPPGRYRVTPTRGEHLKLVDLSDREVEALTWVARGKTSAEIAQILGLSKRTVDFHIDNAREKLGAATRTQAVMKAADGGLIEP